MSLVHLQPSTLQSPTGATPAIYSCAAIGKPKAIIHINHGMAEHGARYDRFAGHLSKAGYHVIAHDHRGHGNTTASDAPLGCFSTRSKSGLDLVIADMAAVNSHANQQFPDCPTVLFGHSMGTILGLVYCLKHSDTIEGAALWNAGFETGLLAMAYGGLLRAERMFKGSDVPSMIAQKLTFEDWNKRFKPNRTEFDWLSTDPKEVDKYVADPLCGFPVSIGLWLNVLEAIYMGADDRQLQTLPKDLPFHLQAGALDPCTNNGLAVQHLYERFVQAGFGDVHFNRLEGCRHESLNELDRDKITADFIRWLDARWA